MSVEEKRAAALVAVVEHLLAEGLENTGIRSLAKSAGISDRMLIYYFGTKDQLIEEALQVLAERTSDGLQLLIGEGRHSSKAILELVHGAWAIPEFENAMKLYLEVAARASRGLDPFRASAKTTLRFWEEWLDDRLSRKKSEPSTRELLVTIEGLIYIHLIESS